MGPASSLPPVAVSIGTGRGGHAAGPTTCPGQGPALPPAPAGTEDGRPPPLPTQTLPLIDLISAPVG